MSDTPTTATLLRRRERRDPNHHRGERPFCSTLYISFSFVNVKIREGSTIMATNECMICAEPMSLSFWATKRRMISRPCCGQVCCQSCLFRHIMSITEEGITNQGRSKILCPLGCGQSIQDSCIRECIQREYKQNVFQRIWGIFIMALVTFTGWFELQDPMRTSRYYLMWMRFMKTSAERAALRRYQQWNLAVGLRQSGEETMTCPAPDCGCTWIVASPRYRHQKRVHEQQRTFLWYSPLKPEPNDNMWVLSEYVNLLIAPPEEETRDGRRAVCPKCHALFCGICRSPWNATRRKSHAGVTCKTHRKNFAGADSEYAFVGQLQNARTCPGCSLRTSRVDGCNHMTCPCGKEWCYVCERSWNATHYTCVDRPRSSSSSAYEMCVIS